MIKLFDEDMNEVQMDQDEYQKKIFPLENFSPFGLMIDEKYFQTSEHAFQYLKFADYRPLVAITVKNANSPTEARKLAQKYKKEIRPDWDIIKYSMIERIIRAKLDFNLETLKKVLLDTENYKIIESIDKNNQDENQLGEILMKIRKELKEELENDIRKKR